MAGDIFKWSGASREGQDSYPAGVYRDLSVLPRSPAEALEPDHAPEPPRGSRRRQQHPIFVILNSVMTFLFVGLIGLAALFYFIRTQFDRPGPLNHATVIVIPKDEGVRPIAARLEREGIISDQRIFVASVIYFRAHKRLKAGEYAVKREASIREVLDTLVEGRPILYSIGIPEGLTTQQVIERLNAHPELVGDITSTPAEGSLLPDTYRFARGTTREDMVRRLQHEQKKFLEKVWPTRAGDLPVKTKEDAINLASIVEKETGRADERPRVAAVFVNRLRKNIRLESDPTIIYGLVAGKGGLGRGILRSELEQTTPYNTYRIKGLPPTPIANPGRAAIEAVLRPAKTPDLFFVADGSGGHAFTDSFAEHQKNVARWRVIEKQQQAEQETQRQQQAGQDARQPEGESVAAIPGAAGGDTAEGVNKGAAPQAKLVQIPLPERKPAR